MDHDTRLRSPLVAHDPIDEQSLIVLSVLHFLCPPETGFGRPAMQSQGGFRNYLLKNIMPVMRGIQNNSSP
jgi:hypothetical protein